VLGRPIGHSLSPLLHRAAYAHLGLAWRYERRECGEQELAGVVAEAVADPAWAGFSLTMPCKAEGFRLAASCEPVAAAIGAVNTLLPGERPGDGPRGANTDVEGMLGALREAGGAAGVEVGRAVVLGGGGTALAALAALGELDCPEPVFALRNPARGTDVRIAAERLGVSVQIVGWDEAPIAGADLVISTTPAGATDALAAQIRWDAHTVLLDAVYAPWPTRLAAVAQAGGAVVLGGRDLLVHQAVGQVLRMTGRTVPVEVLRGALPA
jgi:shikimate dehydrogenase